MTSIDYSGTGTTVTCRNGSLYQGSKVIITVPVAQLKERVIQFNPPLPAEKMEAVDSLGAGQVEKVWMGLFRLLF